MTHKILTDMIARARKAGIEITITNYEIEIEASAGYSVAFNRNDPASVKAALRYLKERIGH